MDVAPAGSTAAYHPGGWMQTDIFTKWVDHFVHFIKPSTDDPVLLIVDCHYSNTQTLDVVDKASEHSVAIDSLTPHSEHKIQPLDVGFMKSLKRTMHKNLKRGLTTILVVLLRLSYCASFFGPAFIRYAKMDRFSKLIYKNSNISL